VASLIVKLPQLLKILGAKSGAGLSVLGITLELLAVTFNAAYSYGKRYPFSAWGEASFLIVETAAIAFLVIWFDGKRGQAMVFGAIYSAGLAVLLSGAVSIDVLWALQAANLPLAVIGKLIQAQKNYSNGHTGHLSALTVCLLCGGCVARIFTSIQETGDSVVVATFVAASVANAVLVAQVFYYWKSTNSFLQKEAKKKRK
jgi:mannose-P-dolichol utilization defect protein 1